MIEIGQAWEDASSEEGVVRPPKPRAETGTYLPPLSTRVPHTWLRGQAFVLKTSLALQKSGPPTNDTYIAGPKA
jgi:hypothetical protein